MPVTPPNFTQIPNEILDRMSDMTPAEFKVLTAICRKTFGWHKRRDVISLSQLEAMTGLSRSAVQSGIMAAIERGMLERKPVGKQSFSYQLVVSDYQSSETTSSVRLPEPVVSDYQQLVASDYPQKKELNKGNKGGGVANTNGHAAADETIDRLMDCGLTESQAKTAIKAQSFDDGLLCRLFAWSEQIRSDGKKPGAILCGYTNKGKLPDDIPPPPPPVLSDEDRMRQYLADFNSTPATHATYRKH